MSFENGLDGLQGELDYLLNKINGTEVAQHTSVEPIEEEDLDQFLQTINRTEATNHNHGFTKVCPLCNSLVRFFYINLNEKFLMCENTSCEFPFGYEEQYIKVDPADHIAETSSDFKSDYANINKNVEPRVNSTSWSTLSIPTSLNTDNQTELEEINELHDNENLTKNKAIDKNLVAIKELNKKYNSLDRDHVKAQEQSVIKNEKWIEKLRSLQTISGAKLLKPEEMCSSRRTENGLGEYKIDIDPNNVTGAKINVLRENPNENMEEVETPNQNVEDVETPNQNMEEAENQNPNMEEVENPNQNLEIEETEAEEDLPELYEVIIINDQEPSRFT